MVYHECNLVCPDRQRGLALLSTIPNSHWSAAPVKMARSPWSSCPQSHMFGPPRWPLNNPITRNSRSVHPPHSGGPW